MKQQIFITCRLNGAIVDIRASTEINGKLKEINVPYEQCSLQEFHQPSPTSINYWKHYGQDRNSFKLAE